MRYWPIVLILLLTALAAWGIHRSLVESRPSAPSPEAHAPPRDASDPRAPVDAPALASVPNESPSTDAEPPRTGLIASVVRPDGSLATDARFAVYERWYSGFGGEPYRSKRPLAIGVAGPEGMAVLDGLPANTTLVIDFAAPGGVPRSLDLCALESGELRTLPPLDLEPAGTVTGVVRDRAGRLLAGVTVAAENEQFDDWGDPSRFSDVSRAVSDESGRFVLGSLRPGETTIFAVRAGYHLAGVEADVSIDRVTEVELTLEPSLAYRAAVIDAEGQPVVGATVRLDSDDFIDRSAETTTDEAGRFTFETVPTTEVTLTVLRGDSWWTEEFASAAGDEDRRDAADSVDRLPEVIVLSVVGQLHLEILDADGVPRPAEVGLANSDFTGRVTIDPADPLLESMPVGVYELEVEAEGFEPARVEVTVELDTTVTLTVVLTALETTPVTVECKDVHGEPTEGVEVWCGFWMRERNDVLSIHERSAITDAEGRVTLAIPARSADPELYLLASGGGWAPKKARVERGPGTDAPIIMTLVPASELVIRTTTSDGRITTLPFVWARREKRDDEPWASRADNFTDGRRFVGLPSGVYTVGAEYGGLTLRETVTLEPGEARVVEMTFPRTFPVDVWVRVNGALVTDGWVTVAFANESEAFTYWDMVSVAGSGAFRLEVPTAGTYSIEYEHEPVEIEKIVEIHHACSIELTGERYRVSGCFVDEAGRPVASREVTFELDRDRSKLTLGEDGSFSIEVDDAGVYQWSIDDLMPPLFGKGSARITAERTQQLAPLVVRAGREIRVVLEGRSESATTSWSIADVTNGRSRVLAWSGGTDVTAIVPKELTQLHLVDYGDVTGYARLRLEPDRDVYTVRLRPAARLSLSIDPTWRVESGAARYRVSSPGEPMEESMPLPARGTMSFLFDDLSATVTISNSADETVAEKTVSLTRGEAIELRFP
ncbi:MAG: carboxypeptidase regulatory-like domain-containing protein [Planctomycetes bacterium]|nr:carboxypeptidase regulatory-like domain-containing protein [Planctomycetota bacterium]